METLPLNKFIFLLRLLTLFIGATDLVLTAYAFSEYTNEEEFLLSFIVISFLITSTYLIGYYFTEWLANSFKAKYTDVCLHLACGFLLMLSGAMMMLIAVGNTIGEGSGITVLRTLSGLFGIQNGIIYILVAILTLRTVPYSPSKHGEGLEWEDPLIETHEAKKVSFGTIMGK